MNHIMQKRAHATSSPQWPQSNPLPSMPASSGASNLTQTPKYLDPRRDQQQYQTANDRRESPPSTIPLPPACSRVLSLEAYASADHPKDKDAENSTAVSKARKMALTFERHGHPSTTHCEYYRHTRREDAWRPGTRRIESRHSCHAGER